MKKLKLVLLSMLCAFAFMGTAAASTTEQISSIDSLLQPYQDVIDRLNAEFGVDVYIPDDNKEEVYNNLKGQTLVEFEEKLRRELSFEVCHIDEASNIIIDDQVFREYAEDYITILPADIGHENEIRATPLGQMRAERDDCTQTWWSDGISYIRLSSTVWSQTGAAGSFIYSSINNVTSGWIPGSGQFFWAYSVSLANCSLNSSSTICTVSGTRAKRNDDGLYLTVASSYSVLFYSSETN